MATTHSQLRSSPLPLPPRSSPPSLPHLNTRDPSTLEDDLSSSSDDMGVVSVSSSGSFDNYHNKSSRLSVSSWCELDLPSSCKSDESQHITPNSSPLRFTHYSSSPLPSPAIRPTTSVILSPISPALPSIPESDIIPDQSSGDVAWGMAKVLLSTLASSLFIDPNYADESHSHSLSLTTVLPRSSHRHSESKYYDEYPVVATSAEPTGSLLSSLFSPFSSQISWWLGSGGDYDRHLSPITRSQSSASLCSPSHSDAMDTLGTRLFLSSSPDLDGFVHSHLHDPQPV